MSRIGKKPVDIPAGVKVNVAGGMINAESPAGKLSFLLPSAVKAEVKEGRVVLSLTDPSQNNLYGTLRTRVFNMVSGLVKKFEKTLSVVGTGYKAEVKAAENKLLLSVGYTGQSVYSFPKGITIEVDKQNNIKISGIDKDLVGKVASEIRKINPPEPYQGKGIRYMGEVVRKKAGKTQAGAAAAVTK